MFLAIRRALLQSTRSSLNLSRTSETIGHRNLQLPALQVLDVRYAHSKSRTGGVKGIKGRKFNTPQASNADDDGNDDDDGTADDPDALNIDDTQYEQIANTAMHVSRGHQSEQHVFVVQPYVKWGPRRATEPTLQLQEAEALVRSLPSWSISHSLIVPLESLDRRQLFGSGKLQELHQQIGQLRSAGQRVTCVFVSKGQLSGAQKRFLTHFFGLPVMDRYSVVIQILRLHATSNEARLQVAAAEIPYIWSQLKDGGSGSGGGGESSSLSDTQKEMLRTRERKLRAELKRVRSHRELLRNRRSQLNFPIVAVVGYTNAGKTSLIKALTADAQMQPRNQLFATLDVTAHAGHLPSKLKVIYMDTVGFMADLPTGLIECFVATLEDAMLADVIVHVHDLAHPSRTEQARHVEQTMRELMTKAGSGHADRNNPMDSVLQVGNKADLLAETDETVPGQLTMISSKTGAGIEELRHQIEQQLLRVTQRTRMTVRVPMGGAESSWLYKNAAVTESVADPNNAQNLLLSVVISATALQKFRHQFVRRRE